MTLNTFICIVNIIYAIKFIYEKYSTVNFIIALSKYKYFLLFVLITVTKFQNNILFILQLFNPFSVYIPYLLLFIFTIYYGILPENGAFTPKPLYKQLLFRFSNRYKTYFKKFKYHFTNFQINTLLGYHYVKMKLSSKFGDKLKNVSKYSIVIFFVGVVLAMTLVASKFDNEIMRSYFSAVDKTRKVETQGPFRDRWIQLSKYIKLGLAGCNSDLLKLVIYLLIIAYQQTETEIILDKAHLIASYMPDINIELLLKKNRVVLVSLFMKSTEEVVDIIDRCVDSGNILDTLLNRNTPTSILFDKIDVLFAENKCHTTLPKYSFKCTYFEQVDVIIAQQYVDEIDVLLRKGKDFDYKTSALLSYKKKLKDMIFDYEFKEQTSGTHPTPIGIMVSGPPKTCKSYVMSWIGNIIADIYEVPSSIDFDSIIYHKNPADAYFSNKTNNHTMLFIDDIGAHKGNDNPLYSELLRIMSPHTSKLNMPDLPSKGKTHDNFMAVICSTNSHLGGCYPYLNNPGAFMRRFISLKPHVKPQYRLGGDNTVDDSKIPPGTNTEDIIEIEIFVPDQVATTTFSERALINPINNSTRFSLGDAESRLRSMFLRQLEKQSVYNSNISDIRRLKCNICSNFCCICNSDSLNQIVPQSPFDTTSRVFNLVLTNFLSEHYVDPINEFVHLAMGIAVVMLFFKTFFGSKDDVSKAVNSNSDDIETLDSLVNESRVNSNNRSVDYWAKSQQVEPLLYNVYKDHRFVNVNDLKAIVNKNLYILSVYDSSKDKKLTFPLLAVRDSYYLTYGHWLQKLVSKKIPNIKAELMSTTNFGSVNPSREVVLDLVEDVDVCVNKDFGLVRILGPSCKDITRHFPKESFEFFGDATLLMWDPQIDEEYKRRDVTYPVRVTNQLTKTDFGRRLHKADPTIPEYDNAYSGVVAEKTFTKGCCGSVAITSLHSNTVSALILGLHTFGSTDGLMGGGVIVYQKDISSAITRLSAKLGSAYQLPPCIFDFPYQIIGTVPEVSMTNLSPKSSLRKLQGVGEINGTIEGYYPSTFRSMVVPQLFKDVVIDNCIEKEIPRYAPVLQRKVIDGKYVDPFLTNLEYMVQPKNLFSSHEILMSYRSYLTRYNELKFKIAPLSVLEGINGNKRKFINCLVMSTGTGIGTKGIKSDHFEQILDKQGNHIRYEFKSEEQEIFDKLLAEYTDGKVRVPIWQACLKDEPVKLKKKYATRLFSCAPYMYNIIMRMYILPILDIVQSNPFRFESAVGVNCFSTEWDNLFTYLGGKLDAPDSVNTKNIIAGDYKKFDKLMAAELVFAHTCTLLKIAEIGGYSNEQLLITRNILYGVVFPLTSVNGDLIQLYCTNPAGSPITVSVNSGCNSIYTRIAYYRHMKHIKYFNKHVNLITYGDDNVMKVEKDCTFNFAVMQEMLAKSGVEYTDPEKREGYKYDYMSLAEVSFLKRSFTLDVKSQFVRCPLDRSSLQRMMQYRLIKSSQNPIFVYKSMLDSYFYELYQYGQEEYNKQKNLVDKYIINPDGGLPLSNYIIKDYSQISDLVGREISRD